MTIPIIDLIPRLLSKGLRLWHTLRYLKPVQITNRLTRKLRRIPVDLSPAPTCAPVAAVWRRCARRSSMTGPDHFTFLSESRTVPTAADWDRLDWPRLWRYNLHYHDDLASDQTELHRSWHEALIRRWIDENPPARGTGWEPYCLSLRIVNWIKWLLADPAGVEPPLAVTMRHSLAIQVRALEGQLEHHLLGNHLWANAKALVFAGLYFDGPEASRWRGIGDALLKRELAEQVLPDGGHFERSPMYHAIALEDVLDLIQLSGSYPGRFDSGLASGLARKAPRMLRWLEIMSHPDGEIALFNDAALGIAPTVAQLSRYAALIGLSTNASPLQAIEHLADSGYIRLSMRDAVVIMDVGDVGPDYLPGHAHADTLSFEWSLGARRMLVNGGTSTYEMGELRSAQRGTGMHNTVVLDGRNSSDVWGGFRTGRRARPLRVEVGRADGAVFAGASHDGYRYLPGRPIHVRTVALAGNSLTITDRIERAQGLSPGQARKVVGLTAEAVYRFTAEASDPWVEVEITGGPIQWEQGHWYPRFGQALPVRVGRLTVGSAASTACFRWLAAPDEMAQKRR